MSKIAMTQVYRRLWSSEQVQLACKLGRNACPLTFSEFEKIMMADDFISCSPTVKGKWKAAESDRIIFHSADVCDRSRGFIDLQSLAGKLREHYVPTAQASLKKEKEKEKKCVSEGIYTRSGASTEGSQ